MISRVHPLLFNVTVISMLVQIICRIITFSLNTLFIKVSNPTLTGVATLRLDALFNAILALSRTAHRNACIKFLHQDNGETNKHLNLLLDKLGSLILSHSFFDVLVLIAWQCVLGLRIDSVPPLVIIFALFSFTLSAFIVIVAAEPLYIISVCTEQTLARLMSESIFTVSKPLLLFLILRLQKHHAPSSETLLINLSATQMISALLYVFFMRLLVQFPAPTRKNKISSATCSQNSNKSTVGMPDKVEKCKLNRTLIDAPDSLTKFEVDHLDVENLDGLLKTIDDEAKLLSKQIRLDYVLKNHNTYCVNFLLPPNDQGLYAVASNYGSVVTRLLYQPIENAASLFYASKALDLQKGIYFVIN